MARALVTKLRIPDTAAQTRKSPVARPGGARGELSRHLKSRPAARIFEFESHHPASQPGLHQLTCECPSKPRGTARELAIKAHPTQLPAARRAPNRPNGIISGNASPR